MNKHQPFINGEDRMAIISKQHCHFCFKPVTWSCRNRFNGQVQCQRVLYMLNPTQTRVYSIVKCSGLHKIFMLYLQTYAYSRSVYLTLDLPTDSYYLKQKPARLLCEHFTVWLLLFCVTILGNEKKKQCSITIRQNPLYFKEFGILN